MYAYWRNQRYSAISFAEEPGIYKMTAVLYEGVDPDNLEQVDYVSVTYKHE